MEKLSELFGKICSASERGKKGVLVDLQTISEIRDEFWALEQEKEAAEVEGEKNLLGAHAWEEHARRATAERDVLQTKLAELAKQDMPPSGSVQSVIVWDGNQAKTEIRRYKQDCRPAPAADLAGLVPSEFPAIRLQKAKLWIDRVLMDKPGMKEAQTISAILRKIKEAK